MKNVFKIHFLLLIILCSSILSCKKDNTNPESPSTYKYYLIATVGSEEFRVENSYEGECYEFENIVCFPLFQSATQVGTVDFEDMSADSVRSDYFLQMKGKTYPNSSTVKVFGLNFTLSGVGYSTGNISIGERTGSFIVTDVVADGFTSATDAFDNPYKCFKLTGTFTCKVANNAGTIVKEITDGKFSIRLNESER
jgi:hypothetical protein